MALAMARIVLMMFEMVPAMACILLMEFEMVLVMAFMLLMAFEMVLMMVFMAIIILQSLMVLLLIAWMFAMVSYSSTGHNLWASSFVALSTVTLHVYHEQLFDVPSHHEPLCASPSQQTTSTLTTIT